MTSLWFPPAAPSVVLSLLVLCLGCESGSEDGQRFWDPAPYQAEVEEGLGATVAVLIDTSNSMKAQATLGSPPKHEIARDAVQDMLDATDEFLARRPDYPIKIAIYHFGSNAWLLHPVRSYNRNQVQEALTRIPPPGGGTAIGEAMLEARQELYREGTFRKYLLVITDGQNSSGRDPDQVARRIYRKSGGAVQIYFVAFDTSPEQFAFLREVGGDVLAARDGAQLRTALDDIYLGKILVEEIDAGETGLVR